MKTLRIIVSILLISCSIGCQQLQVNDFSNRDRSKESLALAATDSNLSEVTIPKTIRELKQSLEQYSPLVKIIAPQPGQTFKQTDIEIKLAVTDLPLFQDDRLNLGNHLSLVVDNEALPPVYDLEQPILLKNLMPGTHTLRAFATAPWGESFKNSGAYAQATFNVLTETSSNYPDPKLPLLTYNSPTGSYGAEPILLDFYLNYSNSVSNGNDNEIEKPSVRATVNGTSFIIEKWQPYYLTGFEPGENWVQLELIDRFGNDIENTYNNTVRVFNYSPQQQDTLSKLVTNRISANEAKAIVEQNYYIQPVGTPAIIGSQNNSEPQAITDFLDNESAIVSEQVDEKDASIIQNDRNELQKATEKTTVESAIAEEKADNSDLPAIVHNAISETQSELELERQSSKLEDTPSSNSTTQTDLLVKPSNIEPVTIATQPKSTPTKIVIKELETKEPLVEIEIPQPESLEIKESEIAIAPSPKSTEAEKQKRLIVENNRLATRELPTPRSEQQLDLPEVETKTRFLWWKKLLVGLRQTIESLARQLPQEV